MSETIRIQTAPIFERLLEPSRDKGAYGGRGSGKSHFFAGRLIDEAVSWPGDTGEGLRAICGREVQKSLKDSAKYLMESKIAEYRLTEADGFKVFNDVIKTPGDGLIVFQGLQDHTADSIKSFEGFHRFWGEEAHSISSRSIGLIRPTIRWESRRLGMSSEMWWSWNPLRKADAVDMLLRGEHKPTGAIVVRANWSDNPWFPSVLEQERQDCMRLTPDQYEHIWEGGYATVLSGAYYAKLLTQARLDGRVGRVAPDPLMTIRLFMDIGGTGARADAFSIWATQFIGREIRVLDYYEAVGQPIGTHVAWMRKRGYTPDRAQIWLPHDGANNDRIYDASYESEFRRAGYTVTVVPNQGTGAAGARVEASRRILPACWFNAPEGADHETQPTCSAGLEALGWYHEKRDEQRGIGLGPDHDWSSHGADAFGLAGIVYEPPRMEIRKQQSAVEKFLKRNRRGSAQAA